MTRTIVETTTAGWFINAEDPDGKRVRKQDGDTVISLEDYQARKDGAGVGKLQETLEATGSRTPTQVAAAKGAEGAHKAKAARNTLTRDKDAPPSVVSETGKVLVGKTTVIKCDYREDDTYSIVGGKAVRKHGKGKVCGKERVIKVQDAFQVTMCVEHAQRHKLNQRKAFRASRKKDKTPIAA